MASTASFSPRVNITNSSAPAPEPTPESTGEVFWLSERVQSPGEGEDFIIEIDYDLDLFQSLYINGTELTLNEDYILEEGSTIIVLDGRYVEKLKSGEYNLIAKYSDGAEFTTTFAISENPEEFDTSILVPDTGSINAQMFGANLGRNMPFILSGLLIILVSFFAIRKYLLPHLKARSYAHSTFKTTTSFRPTKRNTSHSLTASIVSIKNRFFTKNISLSRTSKTGLNIKSHKLITAIAGITLVAGGAYFCLNALTPNANEETAFAAPTDQSTLSLSTSDGNFTKDVDLKNGNVFVSTSQTVTVNDATAHGYKLFISTNSSKYNDLSINGSITADARILSTSNTFANPGTLEADSYGFAVANSTFGTNYAPSATSKWAGVPILGAETAIKETTSATPANDSTTVYYGFNLTNNLPDGSYYGTNNSAITYKAVATVLPTYTVNYYCNGGSGSIASQTTDIGTSVTVSTITGCERENYTFKHWNTVANNSGTLYSPGATYTGDQNVNLYAIWEKTTPTPNPEDPEEPEPAYYSFILNYNANGGSNAPASDSKYITKTNTSFTIGNTKPTRADHEFKGWCTTQTSDATCSGTTYQSGATITFSSPETITLYAIWQYIEPAKVLRVGILNGDQTILYNKADHTVKLTATIETTPSVTEKGVEWYSENTKVATVKPDDSGNNPNSLVGLVTAVDAGETFITARSKFNNDIKARVKVTVKKNVLIILGASQIQRITDHRYANIRSYTTSSGNTYSTKVENQWGLNLDKPKNLTDTLNFIYYYGHGYQFETAQNWSKDAGPTKEENKPPYSGWSFAKKIISHYKNLKDHAKFYVYFTISGNDTKYYSCEEINNNASKTVTLTQSGRTIVLPTISNQVKRYDEIIAEFSNDGYDIRGYVTSQHPMRADQGGDKKSYVKNNDPTHCNAGRRSNFKYYTVNTTYKKYVKSSEYPNISFVDTFTGIVDTSGDKAKWTFKSDWKSYSTVDGIHWDDKTAEKYFKYWMGLNKSL